MSTRSGTIDPGLALWLISEGGMTAEEVDAGLEHHAGLAGLTGATGDMRAVLDAASGGDERAQLALDVYIHRLRREIGGMVGILGGLDVLVFTGGVGEHSAPIRARATELLGYAGVRIDTEANEAVRGDADITGADATARTLVVVAREDLEIARQTRAALGG